MLWQRSFYQDLLRAPPNVFANTAFAALYCLGPTLPSRIRQHGGRSTLGSPRADASVDALRTPGHMSSKRQQTKTLGEPGERQPVVLVDMDGTIADFDARAYALLAERHPEVKLPPFEQRVYPLSRGVPASQRPLVTALFKEAGFFRELAPIEGAVEALRQATLTLTLTLPLP